MIKSYLKNEVIFLEDTLVSSKYVGICGFEKYKASEISNSLELSALYLKNSNAEEKIK